MDCLRCKEEMIKAKLKGDAVGTVVYLTNKKNGTPSILLLPRMALCCMCRKAWWWTNPFNW